MRCVAATATCDSTNADANLIEEKNRRLKSYLGKGNLDKAQSLGSAAPGNSCGIGVITAKSNLPKTDVMPAPGMNLSLNQMIDVNQTFIGLRQRYG